MSLDILKHHLCGSSCCVRQDTSGFASHDRPHFTETFKDCTKPENAVNTFAVRMFFDVPQMSSEPSAV